MKALFLSVLVATVLAGAPISASAQTIEFAPVAGYRFDNDLFEAAANAPVDVDGAPVVGGALNVDMGEGLSFEALFTHQQAQVTALATATGEPAKSRIVVNQWLAGGRQEFGMAGVRPFLSGLLGLTHYGADGDDEVRFTVGAGGGVKTPLQRRIGLRLDSRVLATFADFDARATACAPGVCLVNVHAKVVWQLEFTAGVIVVF